MGEVQALLLEVAGEVGDVAAEDEFAGQPRFVEDVAETFLDRGGDDGVADR